MIRHFRLWAAPCILLYTLVGFLAGACPSFPGETTAQHHHHKPATHAFACAWACHAGVSQHAIDPSSPFRPLWLVAILVGFIVLTIDPLRLVAISARPPPF